MNSFLVAALPILLTLPGYSAIATVAELVEALASTQDGVELQLAAGTFLLSEPLTIPPGITLRGAGIGKTILTNAPHWQANCSTLPDPEINHKKFDKTGYLLRLQDKASGITVSDLTLTGPRLHGALYGWGNAGLHLHHLHFEDFLSSGIRTYSTTGALIEHCVFVDTGQRWQKGKPGLTAALQEGPSSSSG